MASLHPGTQAVEDRGLVMVARREENREATPQIGSRVVVLGGT